MSLLASIQKTPSGNYQVRYKDGSGKHRAKTFPKGKKKLADDFLHSVQSDISAGRHIVAERGSAFVPEWVQEWHDGRVDIAVSTRSRTQGIITGHVTPKWSKRKISDVQHADVQRWVSELLDAGQSPRSAKKIINVLSQALDAAVKDRRLASNPADGVRFPRAKPRAKIYLSADQVEELASVVDDRQRVIVYTLAYTGLRWGELAGLRVKDLDPVRRRLNVEQTIVDDNGRSLVKPPKDNEIRSVPAPRFVVDMLVEQGEGMGSDDLLFRSPRGYPLRNRHERGRWFDAAAEAIGEPDLTPHGLRHAAASMAISAGASVLAVQRMLGHSSATVTLDVYSELFDGDLDELAERLDRVRAESRLRGSYANDSNVAAE